MVTPLNIKLKYSGENYVNSFFVISNFLLRKVVFTIYWNPDLLSIDNSQGMLIPHSNKVIKVGLNSQVSISDLPKKSYVFVVVKGKREQKFEIVVKLSDMRNDLSLNSFPGLKDVINSQLNNTA